MSKLEGTEAQLVNMMFNTLHALKPSICGIKKVTLSIDDFENYLHVYQNFEHFMRIFLDVLLCRDLLRLVEVDVRYGSRKAWKKTDDGCVETIHCGIVCITLQVNLTAKN